MLKILLVDDETAERKGLLFLINKFKLPLEAHEASNGKEALQYIKTHETDILLTDIKMPFLGGLDLAKEVRDYNPKIKIIIFSAYSEFDYAKKAIEVEAINYLLKPIEVDEFKTVMEKVIKLSLKEKQQELDDKAMQKSFIEIKKSERNKALATIIKSPEIQEDQIDDIHKKAPGFDGHIFTLLSMKTEKNFFNKEEKYLKNVFSRYLKEDFEYIYLTPSESYIVICSRSKPKQKQLFDECKRAGLKIKEEKNIAVSIVVGTAFGDIIDFPKKVHEIETVSTDLFYNNSNVILAENLTKFHEESLKDANAIIKKAEDSIDSRNLIKVKENINELIEHLKRQPAISAIYTRYIFWDIFKKLYIKYNVAQSIIDFRMESLLKSENLNDLSKIFDEILEDLEVEETENISNASQVTETVMRIIHTEYRNDLSLDYLAKKVFLTPSYLSSLFKQQTGENIVKFISSYRMEKAKEMLSGGTMKIVDICKACGFENPSYFNYQFRVNFGITPKQYREKCNEKI